VNAQNDVGIAPLHLAGSPGIAEILVRRGADLHLTDQDGRTPVWIHAMERDGGRVLLRLLELGADPNVPDRTGRTALDIATRRYAWDKQPGEASKLEVLRRFGGRPGTPDAEPARSAGEAASRHSETTRPPKRPGS
jgi:hypothetical protein